MTFLIGRNGAWIVTRVKPPFLRSGPKFRSTLLCPLVLSFAQRDVPLPVVKRILRDSLRGIAALHEKGIVHTDIKANNILVDWDTTDGNATTVRQVLIADIEDAAYVPDHSTIVGRQVGNWIRRCPEAHASGQVHKPSDIFSFGLVVSIVCAILK